MTVLDPSEGLCHCGCGQRTAIASCNNRSKGQLKGQPVKFVSGHNRRGTGIRVHFKNQGRWYVTTRQTDKHMTWSHVVMWNQLGRPLAPGEVVHHLDGNPDNDEPSNLAIMPSHSAHMQLHHEDLGLNLLTGAIKLLGKARVQELLDV